MTNQDTCSHTPQLSSAGPDLSKSIDESLERLPGEQLRSVRVFGDWYRCNWWVRSRSDWLGVATGRISRSRFLHVVLDGPMQHQQSSAEMSTNRLAIIERM